MKKLVNIYTIICTYIGAYFIGKIVGEKAADLIMNLFVEK